MTLPVFKTGGRLFEAAVCSTHMRFRQFSIVNSAVVQTGCFLMKDGSRTPSLLLLSLGLAIVPVACAAYPFYVIRPSRPQGARELAAALFMKQVSRRCRRSAPCLLRR